MDKKTSLFKKKLNAAKSITKGAARFLCLYNCFPDAMWATKTKENETFGTLSRCYTVIVGGKHIVLEAKFGTYTANIYQQSAGSLQSFDSTGNANLQALPACHHYF